MAMKFGKRITKLNLTQINKELFTIKDKLQNEKKLPKIKRDFKSEMAMEIKETMLNNEIRFRKFRETSQEDLDSIKRKKHLR